MPQPDITKLHLNEHISPRLANQLRKYGFDVTSSQESNLLSEPDDKQLEFAATERRAIVTFNVSDFMALHERYLVGRARTLGDHFLVARTDSRFVPAAVETFANGYCSSTQEPGALAQ